MPVVERNLLRDRSHAANSRLIPRSIVPNVGVARGHRRALTVLSVNGSSRARRFMAVAEQIACQSNPHGFEEVGLRRQVNFALARGAPVALVGTKYRRCTKFRAGKRMRYR